MSVSNFGLVQQTVQTVVRFAPEVVSLLQTNHIEHLNNNWIFGGGGKMPQQQEVATANILIAAELLFSKRDGIIY